MITANQKIPLYKPFLAAEAPGYINDVLQRGYLGSAGLYAGKCQSFFAERYGFNHTFLINSCTNGLEIAATLMDAGPGDEIIVPCYTYVSTANAFASRGAKVIFADCTPDNPLIDISAISSLLTSRTKAIVSVHYAGVACDMDAIMKLAAAHDLFVVEDAAHAIDSYYTGADGVRRPLGSIGHFGVFSFHETKNVTSGEGGLLVINDPRYLHRAEIILEKGTNRAAFLRGEVDSYEWVDVGSSYKPSEITAVALFAQLQNIDLIQSQRKSLWESYYTALLPLEQAGVLKLPQLPAHGMQNGHIFYYYCRSEEERQALIGHCRRHNIFPSFHYLSLDKSNYQLRTGQPTHPTPNSDYFTECLVRLPLYAGLQEDEQQLVLDTVYAFYNVGRTG